MMDLDFVLVALNEHTLSEKLRFSLGGEMHHAFQSKNLCVGAEEKRQT